MNLFEKVYSVLAMTFAVGLILALILLPQLRQINYLLPISFIGFTLNIGLMFIVLRDIFLRSFESQTIKFLWITAVLILWPSIAYYLFQHGMKPRSA